jgi:hypothetical protein
MLAVVDDSCRLKDAETKPMARSIGYSAALGAGAVLLGLAFAISQAFAVEDTDDSGGGAKASKSCPKRQKI